MWTPDHKGIWSPENILKVWSRGIENDFKLYYTIGKLKLSTNIHYQYILTTNDGNDSPNPHLNKQLIYTPTHKAFSNISAQVQKFRCTLLYNYVGFRYTSADNSTFLDPYQTLGLDLSQTYNFKKYNIKVFLQINNLNNASYQIYTYYPSPMRSYQLGISIHFNQPSKP
jgi:iron complex outermembrane receptor protein